MQQKLNTISFGFNLNLLVAILECNHTKIAAMAQLSEIIGNG